MLKIGRRIIFDKLTGKVICEMGEIAGDVLPREDINELDYVDLEYGQHNDKFRRANRYYIDSNTKKVVFDELREPIKTPEEKIVELENKLLIAEGVI